MLDHITAEDLRKLPCILVAAKEQEEIEKEHYRTVYGIGEDVLFAKDLEEAEPARGWKQRVFSCGKLSQRTATEPFLKKCTILP